MEPLNIPASIDFIERNLRRSISTQKGFRLPQGCLEDLQKIKSLNIKLGHNYVVTQILSAVLPRILEKVQYERNVSLDGLRVSL